MEIILYDSHWKETEIPVLERPAKKPFVLPRPKISLSKAAAPFGFGLVLASFGLLLLTFGPILKAELTYRLSSKGEVVSREYQEDLRLAEEERRRLVAEEAASLGVTPDFSIVIPKISAASRIIPNVNPGDEKAYRKALKDGVAHAAGTNFPGNQGNIFLFAHSALSPIDIANYNAVFYLIKELEPGDQIIVFFAGQKYLYGVNEKLITTANDTRWLTENVNEERLILQTCWPLGTSQKRLLILAKRIG
jgi:sortase A